MHANAVELIKFSNYENYSNFCFYLWFKNFILSKTHISIGKNDLSSRYVLKIVPSYSLFKDIIKVKKEFQKLSRSNKIEF